jgi:hypothetical protein
VFRAEGSHPRGRGRGFESHRILDGCNNASYYIYIGKGNKDSQMGHTKIKIKGFKITFAEIDEIVLNL